jgi:hypothetical protein
LEVEGAASSGRQTRSSGRVNLRRNGFIDEKGREEAIGVKTE